MQNRFFVSSYYTANAGTTDYFLEYLTRNDAVYIYSKHPLNGDTKLDNNIIEYDKKSTQVLRASRSSSNPIAYARNVLQDALILWRYRKKFDVIVCFGSINVMSAIMTKAFLRKPIIFWGVDYSGNRFENRVLNMIYMKTESLACKYSSITVQPTMTQEQMRISKHKLDKEKSIVIPNGVTMPDKPHIEWGLDKKTELIYIGSLSVQHGVYDFLIEFYEMQKIRIPIHIYGDGVMREEIQAKIISLGLEEIIIMHGSVDPVLLRSNIMSSKTRLFGIAPYINKGADHILYGDSLKVKEYLSLGLPFISSDTVSIEKDFLDYGYVYHNGRQLSIIINDKIRDHIYKPHLMYEIASKYSWDNTLKKLDNKIKGLK